MSGFDEPPPSCNERRLAVALRPCDGTDALRVSDPHALGLLAVGIGADGLDVNEAQLRSDCLERHRPRSATGLERRGPLLGGLRDADVLRAVWLADVGVVLHAEHQRELAEFVLGQRIEYRFGTLQPVGVSRGSVDDGQGLIEGMGGVVMLSFRWFGGSVVVVRV